MSGDFIVAVEGLSIIKDLEDLDQRILLAARQAINKTTERSRAGVARMIREQLSFPARYLSGQEGRLTIAKKAQGTDLSGIIRGRDRPTSLARFVRGSKVIGKKGVDVQVSAGGGARHLPGAFLFKLKAGSAPLSEAFNLGLAVRTKDGTKPKGAYKPKQIGKGLWILYGPSIDQAFKQVLKEGAVQDDSAAFLEAEFNRLLQLRKP